MRVFVTGGSGFVGGHLIEGLAGEHEVLAMARSDRSAATVEGFGATAVRCSLGEVPTEALAGVDAVVHAAAYVEEYGPRQAYWDTNVEGTRQLLAAASDAGVRRFILVGTEAVLFDDADLLDVDETAPVPPKHRFLYGETKAEAERLVLAANRDGFTTLSVRPRLVWGPRDASVLPAIKRMADDGGWVWLGGGRARTSTAHVANVVHALTLALTAGRGGEAYFITDGVETTYRAFLGGMAEAAGFTLPDRSLPAAPVRVAARLIEGLWRLLRIRSTPPLTYFAASMMSRSVTVRDDKARRELGYAPVVTPSEGMKTVSVG